MGTIKTYKEQRYATVLLGSGHNVMLSMAQDSIVIYKMRFGGLIPGPKIGSWAPNDLDRFLAKFGRDQDGMTPFRATVEFLATFPDAKALHQYIIEPI